MGAPASSSAKEEGESATERPTGIIANCVGKKEEERGEEEKRAPDVTFLSLLNSTEMERETEVPELETRLPPSLGRKVAGRKGEEGKFLGYHRLPPTLTPPPSRLLLLGREGGRREGGGKKGTLLSILFECSLPPFPPLFFSLLPSVGREGGKGGTMLAFYEKQCVRSKEEGGETYTHTYGGSSFI